MSPDCLSNHLAGGVDILIIFMIFVVLVAIATGLTCFLSRSNADDLMLKLLHGEI